MRGLRRVVALAGLVAGAAGVQAQSYWIDITDPAELRALHTNKTHRGLTGEGYNSFQGYYRADGKALFVQGDKRVERTWEVKGSNQVCYGGDWFPGCRRFQRARTNSTEFNAIHADGWSVLFKVEDGIPQY